MSFRREPVTFVEKRAAAIKPGDDLAGKGGNRMRVETVHSAPDGTVNIRFVSEGEEFVINRHADRVLFVFA